VHRTSGTCGWHAADAGGSAMAAAAAFAKHTGVVSAAAGAAAAGFGTALFCIFGWGNGRPLGVACSARRGASGMFVSICCSGAVAGAAGCWPTACCSVPPATCAEAHALWWLWFTALWDSPGARIGAWLGGLVERGRQTCHKWSTSMGG
jgi:hypothetical protein